MCERWGRYREFPGTRKAECRKFETHRKPKYGRAAGKGELRKETKDRMNDKVDELENLDTETVENIGENLLSRLENLLGNELISRVIGVLIIFIVGIILMKILLHFIRKMLKRSKLDDALHTFIINTAKVILWIFLMVTILSALGVPTTAFITLIGACGAAVALALKDSLSNFAGGILVLMHKPFEKGDYVETNGVGGRVEKIDLLYSTLITLDNKVISIPNGKIATDVVTNFSQADRRRIDSKFGISYNADIKKAKEIIAEVVQKSPLFLADPEPMIGVSEHGDNAVIIDVLVWCNTNDYYPAWYSLYEDVKMAFDENGIEIPFPQVVVHSDGNEIEKNENQDKA